MKQPTNCQINPFHYPPSKPTARKLLGLWERGEDIQTELVTRVEKVLALHRHAPEMQWGNVCCHCFKDWPCPTVRILNGEE